MSQDRGGETGDRSLAVGAGDVDRAVGILGIAQRRHQIPHRGQAQTVDLPGLAGARSAGGANLLAREPSRLVCGSR